VLATPGSPHLSRFIRDPEVCDRIRQTFVAIYPLDDSPAGLKARELALDPNQAKGYVLKPQREGGGNNIYRGAIPAFLRSLPESQWKGYILMELIETPPLSNAIVRNGEVWEGPVICEMGVYGACVWRQPGSSSQAGEDPVLYNEEAGYLLRTKPRDSEEGGVAAGFGSIDSCCLYDFKLIYCGDC
jgi:glutathione synthase